MGILLHGEHALKVQGGKMVRADVEFGRKVENVKITGDFFLHPEDSITDIECFFHGLPLDFGEEETAEMLEGIISGLGAQLIGASAQDVVRAVKGAVSCAGE